MQLLNSSLTFNQPDVPVFGSESLGSFELGGLTATGRTERKAVVADHGFASTAHAIRASAEHPMWTEALSGVEMTAEHAIAQVVGHNLQQSLLA